MSEEGALVMSLVASREGPSWGMAVAVAAPGRLSEATKWRKLLLRRWPLGVTPFTTLVATLEELFMLEPERGSWHQSRDRKHL